MRPTTHTETPPVFRSRLSLGTPVDRRSTQSSDGTKATSWPSGQARLRMSTLAVSYRAPGEPPRATTFMVYGVRRRRMCTPSGSSRRTIRDSSSTLTGRNGRPYSNRPPLSSESGGISLPTAPGVLAVGDQGVIYGLPPDEMGGWQTVLSVPESPGAPDAGPFSPVLTSITGGNGSITVTAEGDQFFQWLPGASGDYYYEPQGDPRTNFAASWQPALATGATDVYLGSNFFGFYWITSTYVGPLDGSTATTVGPDGGATLYQLYGDQVPGGEELAILGIWGTASKVVAVGDLGKVLLFDVLSGNLSVLPSGTQQSFGGVWGSDLEHVWIVGANELILQGSLAGL